MDARNAIVAMDVLALMDVTYMSRSPEYLLNVQECTT